MGVFAHPGGNAKLHWDTHMKKFNMLLAALSVGVLIVAIIIAFVSLGPSNPAPWILVALVLAFPLIANRMEARHFVTWKNEYSVGIESIDNDHKKLLSLINNLQTAAHYQTGETFEKQALDDLVDYTKYHFSREEQLMRENDYPDYDLHKAEHIRMIEKVSNYLSLYNEKGHEALAEIADYLSDWLIHHINGTDQRYSSHLRARGVK